MPYTLTFSAPKQLILRFEAETLEFARQPEGLAIDAQGEAVFQESQALQEYLNGTHPCHVTLTQGQTPILEGRFATTFFNFEPQTLAVLLADI